MARRPGSSSRGESARPGRLDPAAVTSPHRPAAQPDPAPDPNLVLLGEFGRAHGLTGEIRLKSHTGDPLAIGGYGALTGGDGRSYTLETLRPAPGTARDMLIARVAGIQGRTAAEALNRVTLHVARDRLGATEDADEFFTADLVGLAAVDASGVPVGEIVDVPNYGGGDLLEIRSPLGGATALLPFTKAFVPSLDVAGGRVTVLLPEDFFAPIGPKPADDPG